MLANSYRAIVCVSALMITEIKRIIKESEVLKYVPLHFLPTSGVSWRSVSLTIRNREDDTKWPQKNKDGRQELEIRLGSEHISFEVPLPSLLAF